MEMKNGFWIAGMILVSCTIVFAWSTGGSTAVFAQTGGGMPNAEEDAKTVAALDTEYQAAVKNNDVEVMSRILADDFILVTGSGKAFSKTDLLEEARSGRYIWEHQEDTMQTVRVWGNTAVVTAKLWGKGTKDGESFDKTLWFSDTYVRTPSGWRYVFGQASLPLPHITL
jgi:ketosteroid isomerase-like protein